MTLAFETLLVDLPISARVQRLLSRGGFRTVADLLKHSMISLSNEVKFSAFTILELDSVLRAEGLQLKGGT